MLRLLGILAIGNWLFGGRHRRALRRGLLFGALLGFLAHNDFDADRVEKTMKKTAKDVKKAVRKAKKEIREARRTEREERRETIREEIAARKAEREERRRTIHDEIAVRKADRQHARYTESMKVADEDNVAKENEALVNDLERNARFAAMMVNVPTIHFPEDDPKYNSSRKYGYV